MSSNHCCRRTAIAISLALALGAIRDTSASEGVVYNAFAVKIPTTSSRQPAANVVTKCNDDGTAGTLRYEIGQAADGDLIDLSALQCATISLSDVSGEIVVNQYALRIQGPTDHVLAIDGGAKSRVLVHRGSGRLELDDLTIANGFNDNDADPLGGCIHSDGSVMLRSSVVTGCTVAPPTAMAYGGGVDVAGTLYLYDSQLTFNEAESADESFGGGAVVRGSLVMHRSSIDSNKSGIAGTGRGGGAEIVGTAFIFDSTISRNKSQFFGGVDLAGYGGIENAYIVNTTISNNEATASYGGVWTTTALAVRNSTIAFNRAHYSSNTRFVGVQASNAPINITSSIISNNVDDEGAMSDLGGSGTATLSAGSSSNLVTSSNFILPADTIQTCARLQPLADYGGGLLTHLPSADSPVIDLGLDGGLAMDERGLPRLAGGMSDIGAVERQGNDFDDQIFASGVDDLCY